jgi:hypothetical protein
MTYFIKNDSPLSRCKPLKGTQLCLVQTVDYYIITICQQPLIGHFDSIHQQHLQPLSFFQSRTRE